VIERGFSHEALLYAGDESFLAGTLPFIREAVAADEAVLVAVDRSKIELLRSNLNGEAHRVRFADMHELGRNPALIISAWQDFAAESTAQGRGFRGIGEPIWRGRSEAELAECQHHESLLNLAFEDGPSWRLMCPYDSAALPRDVLACAERNHPVIAEDGGQRASKTYRDPLVAGAPFAGPLPEPSFEPARMTFTSPVDLAAIRQFVAEHAAAEGIDSERADGLILAVDEVVTNVLRYDAPGGQVRAWAEEGHMICEVAGGGSISDPLVGRLRPRPDQPAGRGLWIANHFCDLVQIRTGAAGTVVRCHLGPVPGSATT
jgi:anti-sigma regulatory factor (Ser/Thr protein kinase)